MRVGSAVRWSAALLTCALAACASATPLPQASCFGTTELAADSPLAQQIGAAVLAGVARDNNVGSAPVAFRHVGPITRAGDWVVFPASFQRALEPAIFVLRATPDGFAYNGGGWSGIAASEEQIREQLAADVPDAPPDLFTCARLPITCSSGQCSLSLADG